jgi:carboxylesterase type B
MSTQSEDCLYLNVYTPETAIANSKQASRSRRILSRLPVLLWIFGGGIQSDGGSSHA